MKRISSTLPGDQCTFSIYLLEFFLECETCQTKFYRKIQSLCPVTFFENRVVYYIMWEKKVVEPSWHMPIACWIPKARNTHTGYVILTAFLLQRWLNKRSTLLRYSTLPVLLISSYSLYIICDMTSQLMASESMHNS